MQTRTLIAGLAVGGAVALASGALAQGCGPTRLKVTESVALNLPPAKVWAMIGNFQGPELGQGCRRREGQRRQRAG